jgi:hypothetical protein
VPVRPSTGFHVFPMLMACAASCTYSLGRMSGRPAAADAPSQGSVDSSGMCRFAPRSRGDSTRPGPRGVEMPTLPTSCQCITVTCANRRHMRRSSEKIHRRPPVRRRLCPDAQEREAKRAEGAQGPDQLARRTTSVHVRSAPGFPSMNCTEYLDPLASLVWRAMPSISPRSNCRG